MTDSGYLIKTLNMNNAQKIKIEKPSNNIREKVFNNEIPKGNKAVKKPQDKVYKKEEANFKHIATKREESEQPVHPIKEAPRKKQHQ